MRLSLNRVQTEPIRVKSPEMKSSCVKFSSRMTVYGVYGYGGYKLCGNLFKYGNAKR